MMSFTEAVRTCMTEKYFRMSGRASRAEFWLFTLAIYVEVAVILCVELFLKELMEQLEDPQAAMIILFVLLFLLLALLVVIIPSITVSIRRLHDTGRSGWWLLISAVPWVGSIVLLIFFCQPSQPGTNEFGPNPYEAPEEDVEEAK